jgi:phosphopantothenoylcysteine decarboxylase/phosphopantothenate--cysteine ligase
MGREKKLLLGITGGISAYKMADYVRTFAKRNIFVRVAMTKSAENFVTPLTLETLSGRNVWTADWKGQEDPLIHLSESLDYDMVLIAPATANFIGKLAMGIADDFLSTLVLALPAPPHIAPSMNPRMYMNPAVQENLEILEDRGFTIIHPDEGEMACGEEGPGKLPSIKRLTKITEKALGLENDLAGKKIIVTAGRTEEPIDAVRYISNRSSGKMGVAIAASARDRGADVTLIHGPLAVPQPSGVTNVQVRTASEMEMEIMARFDDCDVLVMSAAVADFRPAKIYDTKIKKGSADMVIPLAPNNDILEKLGLMKKKQLLVGFAAETENIIKNAREKMMQKKIDLICANDVSRSDSGFDSDYNDVTFLLRTGEEERTGRQSKRAVAKLLLDKIASLAGTGGESSTGTVGS